MAERLKGRLLEGGLADLVAGPDAYRDLPRLLGLVHADTEEPGGINRSDSQHIHCVSALAIHINAYRDLPRLLGLVHADTEEPGETNYIEMTHHITSVCAAIITVRVATCRVCMG
jgi:hypothetical protein